MVMALKISLIVRLGRGNSVSVGINRFSDALDEFVKSHNE